MPPGPILARTRITQSSHERFGRFSGDLNPLHADPAAARLMEPGAVLAYGMDMVLWALESLAQSNQWLTSLARLRARFLKWVFLEDELALQAADLTREDLQSFALLVNETPVATLELFRGERGSIPTSWTQSLHPTRLQQPREITLEQLEGREGTAALPSSPEAADFYPALTNILDAHTIAELAACSYIIGMEAPGLYSMSMRYDLHFTAAANEEPSTGLHYRVESVDARFRKAKIAVTGTHITGTLEAFVRPPTPGPSPVDSR